MSKIPYYFETPIPKYFREHGWFNNENVLKFVVWAFSKCSTEPRKVVVQGKEITLEPFEFIAGRLSSPKECFLTEKQFRGPTVLLQKAGILKKTANSRANKFSCYVWMVEVFTLDCDTSKGQQKVQQRANRGPTEGHDLEEKKIRSKEDHHPYPSASGLTDDFSSKEEKVKVCEGIFMSQKDLDLCIQLRGSLEKVQEGILFIQGSKKRKHEITDWPNALANWKVENKAKVNSRENLTLAEKLCRQFEEYEKGNGWRIRFYTDKNKDQKGVLFESESAYYESVFVAIADGEFKQKCRDLIEKFIAK